MKSPKSIAEELRAQIDKFKAAKDNVSSFQISNFHQNFRRLTNQFDTPGPKMRDIVNFNVPDSRNPVPVRLYVPFNASEEPGPTLIYLHGGGFVTCDISTHEGICLRMASGSGFRVLSVDYRLAPQHPFPAAPNDCENVLKWAIEGYGEDYGIQRHNLAIGGDSAGGNMTAYLAQKYRADLRCQILYYPLMQLVEMKPQKREAQDILPLGVMALKFVDQHYVAGADTHQTKLSPIFENNLKKLPPAFILTCGLDPLRIEGKAYADKLTASGIPVVYAHEKAMPHGFLNFAKAFPKARKIPLDAADFMRQYMSD